MATETTIKVVESYEEAIAPGVAASVLTKLSQKCFDSLGEPGTLSTLTINNDRNTGRCTLVAIAEVND